MLIVDQDGMKIINFSNILQIYITIEVDAKNYYIRYEDVNNLYEDLGKYKSLERAKEVLEEIVKKYENSMWKLGKNTLSFEDEFIYEMPKEES